MYPINTPHKYSKSLDLFRIGGIALLMSLIFTISQAQVAINEDDSDGDASAALDVKSTNKGVLFPAMTATHRDAIKSPTAGLVIFNLTGGYHNYYNGTNWMQITRAINTAATNPAGSESDTGVGVGIADPDNSAILHVNDTLKGFLLPRLGTNVGSPAEGLMYYDTQTNEIILYANGDWTNIGNSTIGAAAGGAGTASGVLIGDDGTVDASARLEVKATDKGILLPRMTDAQRDAIKSPAEGLTIYNTDDDNIQYYAAATWYEWSNTTILMGTTPAYPGESCQMVYDSNATSNGVDGVYWIDPDGAGGNAVFQAYCDMTTDGGGWTFVGHVNSSYAALDYWASDVGTYRTDLADDGTTYGLGGTIMQQLSDTLMMVTLDGSSPTAADAANKLVFFKYTAAHQGFNTGPIPCTGLASGFEYRTAISGAYTSGGTTNSCTTTTWYTRTAGSASYLTLFHSTALSMYWGAGMGGNNSWYHDGWIWVK